MNNQPAFPTGIITDGKGKIIGGSNGMTLRDYFAAQAMQGFAAACANENDFESWIENNRGMAKSAYEWADAMMKARNE